MFLLPQDSWVVHQTKAKGFGVFAKKEIQAGTIIGDYLGTVIHIADYDIENDAAGLYLMYLTDHASVYPDLHTEGLHLINHSCNPNCWMYIYKGHTLFFAIRTIYPDEEFTIAYLLSPKDDTCDVCTHMCFCGEARCTGTMHLTHEQYTRWQVFQTLQRKKTRRAPFEVGALLKKLSHYPVSIPMDTIYTQLLIS